MATKAPVLDVNADQQGIFELDLADCTSAGHIWTIADASALHFEVVRKEHHARDPQQIGGGDLRMVFKKTSQGEQVLVLNLLGVGRKRPERTLRCKVA